jgi:phospholipase/lecithinase/hemolysin
MRRRIQRRMLAIGMMLLCLLPFQAWAGSTPTIRNLYAFGDSLSDPGNVFSASVLAAGTGLPPLPYFEGRFANGYLWVDYLAEQLGLQLQPIVQLQAQPTAVSFAYGGATSGIDNVINTALPGLLQEVEQFKQFVTPDNISPQALYTLWIGANDYLSERSSKDKSADKSALRANSTQAIENTVVAIRSLYTLGARYFLVANLPALGKTPLAQSLGQETALELNQITKRHNLALEQQLQSLEQALPDLHLTRLDVEQLFEQAIQRQHAFTNVSSPCFDRTTGDVCSNPDQYLFWDGLHPTTAAHQIVANLAAQTLRSEFQRSSKSLPAPSLLVLGTLGLLVSASVIRRSRRSDRFS